MTYPDLSLVTVVLVLGGLLRLALLFRIPPLYMQGDSQSFLLPAYDLTRGLPFDPTLKRPLGYPLLVAMAIWIFGEDLRGLIAAQAILGLGTVLATVVVGHLAFGRAAGALAAALAAIGGQLLIYEHYVLAESVFAFLLTAGVATALLALRRGWWMSLMSGVTFALASQLRPIALAMLPLAAGFLGFVRPPRRGLALAGFVAVGFALVIGPALAFAASRQGATSASALGEVLLWRLTRSDTGYITRDDIQRTEPDSPRRVVVRMAADRALPQEIYNEIRRRFDLGPGEADSILRQVALDAIARQPVRYAASTLRMSAELFLADDQRLGDVSKRDNETRYPNYQSRQRTWFEDRILHLAEPPSAAIQSEYDRADLLTNIYQPGKFGIPLLLLFVTGVVLSTVARPNRLGLLPAATVLLLICANAAVSGPEARFRYPVDPLLGVVAMGGLCGLGGLAVGRARRLMGAGSIRERAALRRSPSDQRVGQAKAEG